MPQPLTHFSPKIARPIVYDDSVFLAIPEHILTVAQIINRAAQLEYWLGAILIGMTNETAVSTVTHHNSLENDAKKMASFNAIASAFLPADKRSLLDKVMKDYRTSMKLRNPFAHSRYAWLQNAPDYLVVIDIRKDLLERAQTIEISAKYNLDPVKDIYSVDKSLWPEIFALRKEKERQRRESSMCYSLDELKSISERLLTSERNLMDFWLITGSPDFDMSKYDQVLSRLNENLARQA